MENGRRYHSYHQGTYHFPNDAPEQERELLKHQMLGALMRSLHSTPLGNNPRRILDLGTGIGQWAIESE